MRGFSFVMRGPYVTLVFGRCPVCSDQCAGKMIMAGVKQVVWLQDDPLIKVSMLKIVARDDGSCSVQSAQLFRFAWSLLTPPPPPPPRSVCRCMDFVCPLFCIDRENVAHAWLLRSRAFRRCPGAVFVHACGALLCLQSEGEGRHSVLHQPCHEAELLLVRSDVLVRG